MLLDNPCSMRVGVLLGGLDMENGDTTTHKRESGIILKANFPTGNVNSNKPDCVN